jgi:lipopolysaccharide export system protein LptA
VTRTATRPASRLAGLFGAAAIAVVALVGADVAAQQPSGPPNALQGFSTNRDQPVTIKAASLEVRDKQKYATFSGNVHVVQGDVEMRCKTLVVFYEDNAAPAGVAMAQAAPAQAGALGGNSQIKRMEARGGVVVTQKDQIATGDRGDFDMRSNTATLTGKVVVTKGQDVLRGEKLVVNLDTGVSKMDAGKGPVEMMIMPKGPPQGAAPAQAQAPAQGQNPTQNQGKSARPARPN